MPNLLNARRPPQLNENERYENDLPVGKSIDSRDDWSDATHELLDSLPRPWTRGLLYFLVIFVGIILPWTMLYKVEETGTARGRLELKGGTVKQEADIAGAAIAVHFKEGDFVKAGDVLMELDSKPVRDELQQNQIRRDGQLNRLDQLQVMKNQLAIALVVQQRQNQAREAEKLAQVNQAQQNLEALQKAYNLQKEEKLAQVNQAQQNLEALQKAYNLQKEEKLAQVEQARQNLESLQKAYNLQKDEKLAQVEQARETLAQNKAELIYAQGRLAHAWEKVESYKIAFEAGALSKNQLDEAKQLAKDNEEGILKAKSEISQTESRLKEQQSSSEKNIHQAGADIEQAKLRLEEQQSSYGKNIHQAGADIEQAKLRLEEQQDNYEKIIHQAGADIEQAKLRLEEQKSAYESLIEADRLAVSKSQQEIKDIETQIASLTSENAQTQTLIKSLNDRLQKYTIRAKKDGTIFQLPIYRPGAVVEVGKLIAEIAPKGSGLVFKGEIPTQETESLWEGEKKDAKLKFDAYRVEDYGVVEGKLVWRSPNSKITDTPQGQVATYEVEIELDKTCIQTRNECIPLTAGQTATAEVIIRQRRIIDFILDPFNKLQKGGLKL